MKDIVPVRTALLSVSDKSGIAELATVLHEGGARLISTGGTREVIAKAGLPVTEVGAVSGNPESFSGRMKTISFQIASGLLFDRERDLAEAQRLGVVPIDLVVANFYPFAANKDRGLSLEELIEFIDIGGPTMVRAAAKNFAWVGVVVHPKDYGPVARELREHGGLARATRERLMRRAFAYTAAYDSMIASHLTGGVTYPELGAPEHLRYGENPHPKAEFRPRIDGIHLDVLGGKELSYNNLVDLDAALAAVLPLTAPAVAVVKHENPCGLASGTDRARLLERAWEGDPVSAFGSVIAFNVPVTQEMLGVLAMDRKEARRFVEIVAAPGFDESAISWLSHNKGLRILRFDDRRSGLSRSSRLLSTGLLTQDSDLTLTEKLEVVSKRRPAELDSELIGFGVHASRCIKSNAIAIVRRRGDMLELLGMGAGQPNRLRSSELAVAQARRNLESEASRRSETDVERWVRGQLADAVLVSDAFFPFADGVEVALAAGIRAIVEPGGSIRDAEIVAACDSAGAALIFTGTRHFRH
ncbi:MAG: bifunctional phosphoribosylaminoimidazolecarboxamide formyltransferase/IMP cyclohydrolase [Deltaproteobacteria bacterium]|nr:bifunctional phosphoribosylaminoimidazolecarboxamide formyltransferase/IMP cyclohydrolase [Deltaproteobacteria bacterium]